jgi:hypothetical protein
VVSDPDDAARVTSRMRALLACLRDAGVPEADLVGVARAGLVLVALREGTGRAVAKFRAWLGRVPPRPTAPDVALARYLRLGRPHAIYFVLVWREVVEARPGAGDDEVFSLLWSALDAVEGERLVAEFEAR